MKPENLRKVKHKNGTYVYIEIIDPAPYSNENEIKAGRIYASTRTPYPTSLYGQIETAGWIEEDRLEPLTKKEIKKVIPTLIAIEEKAKKRSESFYNIYKL